MNRGRWAVVALAATVVALVAGCGSSEITATKLEGSIAPSFGRLYVQQQVVVGNPRPSLPDLRTGARCLKGTPDEAQHGAGSDWVCDIRYLADGPGTPVTAIYDVTVQTDGCYAADGDGPVSLNGMQTITGVGYRQVRNPLWLIDGCLNIG